MREASSRAGMVAKVIELAEQVAFEAAQAVKQHCEGEPMTGTPEGARKLKADFVAAVHALAASGGELMEGDAAWPQTRSAIAMVMLGWGGRPDGERTHDTANAVLDSVTEPGMPLAVLRSVPDWRVALADKSQKGAA